MGREPVWVDVRLPHARGGEPLAAYTPQVHKIAFPTHVGVNRSGRLGDTSPSKPSPRTWG